jgi:hypothetical protein
MEGAAQYSGERGVFEIVFRRRRPCKAIPASVAMDRLGGGGARRCSRRIADRLAACVSPIGDSSG